MDRIVSDDAPTTCSECDTMAEVYCKTCNVLLCAGCLHRVAIVHAEHQAELLLSPAAQRLLFDEYSTSSRGEDAIQTTSREEAPIDPCSLSSVRVLQNLNDMGSELNSVADITEDIAFFDRIDSLHQNEEFRWIAAKYLHRARCIVSQVGGKDVDRADKELIAASYAPVPAVVAACSLLCLQQRPRMSGMEVSKSEFLAKLRTMSSFDQMEPNDVYTVGLFVHAAFGAALPLCGLLGAVAVQEANQSFMTTPKQEKIKIVLYASRAARALLNEVDDVEPEPASQTTQYHVFLGGACNPTSWRMEIAIPALEKASLTFYNPQVDEWTPALVPIEAQARDEALILFFVISRLTRGLASLVEASEYITAGRRVVLVCENVPEGQVYSGTPVTLEELKDLNRGRCYLMDVAKRHNCHVYTTVEEGVQAIVEYFA